MVAEFVSVEEYVNEMWRIFREERTRREFVKAIIRQNSVEVAFKLMDSYEHVCRGIPLRSLFTKSTKTVWGFILGVRRILGVSGVEYPVMSKNMEESLASGKWPE